MDNPVTVSLTETEVREGNLLSDKEIEVLQLIFEGNSSSDVALIMSVSKRTIDFHVAKIYVKLGVNNRFQAYRKAIEMGLIDD